MPIAPAAHYQLLYSQQDIAGRVLRLGEDISPWAAEVMAHTRKSVLAVCILRGAVFFFADLLRSVSSSLEPAFCRTSGYAIGANQLSAGLRIAVEDVAAENRHILLVDDICDSGRTLQKLEKVFLDLGAKEVRSVVLVHRHLSGTAFVPNWYGFVYPGAEWLVGYGMDDRDLYRNLSSIYVIPGSGGGK